jgi:PKD repeat protein
VSVNSAGTATFGAISPLTPVAGQPVSIPLTVTASPTGAAIQSVTVNFGDGTSQPLGAVSGTTTLSHTWVSSGTYTVTATIVDSNGESNPAVTQVTVSARPPLNVTVVASPITPPPVVGQQVAFTVTIGTLPTGVLVQSITIDYGDGSQDSLGSAQSSVIAQHIYSTAGTYKVTVVVRDTLGGASSAQTQVFVGNRPQLAVTISTASTPTTGTATTFAIAATQTSGNTISSVTVDFGDGVRQTYAGITTSVQHVYTAAGSYTVTATATDSSSATGSGSTGILVTGASFTAAKGDATTHSVSFDASSSIAPSGGAITTYSWNFGDGSTATSTSPTLTHPYASGAGAYTVTLTITDSTSKTSSVSKQVIAP